MWPPTYPEALADASIAGVSPVVGLYAAPGALIPCPELGSRDLRLVVAGDIGQVRDVMGRVEGGDEVTTYRTVREAVDGLRGPPG